MLGVLLGGKVAGRSGDMPRHMADVSKTAKRTLELAIGVYFSKREGRGRTPSGSRTLTRSEASGKLAASGNA